MGEPSQQATQPPRDVAARERLRRAQADEARAVAVVCAAQRAVAAACRKRERAVAAAEVAVADTQQTLAAAQAQLVRVSGLERASILLGVDRSKLRRARALTKHDSRSSETERHDGGVSDTPVDVAKPKQL